MEKDNINIADMHVHTIYSYCADRNMIPTQIIQQMNNANINSISFTDHAGQLYVKSEDYWTARFINEPELLHIKDTSRMIEYKKYITNFRTDNTKSGLEVDLDKNGDLTLLEEDRDGWDILLGAIHYLPTRFDNDIKKGYWWEVEAFSKYNIAILAHPFRIFNKSNIKPPEDLFKPLVDLLKNNNIAAELNFHTNTPPMKFFELCMVEGVKISIGSDSHCMDEVGDYKKHIEFLTQICGEKHLNDILYVG